jgi:hypothetical protein
LAKRVLQILKARNLEPSNTLWCKSAMSLFISVRSGLGFAINPASEQTIAFADALRIEALDGDDVVADDSIGWKKNTKNLATQYFLKVVRNLYPMDG